MRNTWSFFLLFLFLPAPCPSEPRVSLDGYYKSFFVVFYPHDVASTEGSERSDRPLGMATHRLRLGISYHPGGRCSFSLAYEISPRIQDQRFMTQYPVSTDVHSSRYRFSDVRTQLYPSEDSEPGSFGVFQNLDRALCTIGTEHVDVFIGRQAIAWGSARVINPTDIMAPFTFEALDTEYRRGVDAIRLRVPLGYMSEFDAGYVFGRDVEFGESAFYLRSRLYLAQTDISLLALGFQENLLIGLDIAGSIGGAGWWFEMAHVLAAVFDRDKHRGGDDYLRTTVGMDYSFGDRTYGFLEYHLSGPGSCEPEKYLERLFTPAFSEGAVYLMGKHYLVPGMTYQITPLITFMGQALCNLSDLSMYPAPEVEYNIAENIYVSAGAFIGLGKRPSYSDGAGTGPVLTYRSEFGGYPDIYFSAVRIYF